MFATQDCEDVRAVSGEQMKMFKTNVFWVCGCVIKHILAIEGNTKKHVL